MKSVLSVLGLVLVSMVALGRSAVADPVQDPALFEADNLTNTCPANCGSF